jgi:predicted NBD/HSP70 family sugar kinase
MKVLQRGLSIEGVQGHNRQVILKTLHNLGTCSRKEISVESGLDQATVTRAIGALVDSEIVEEVGLVKGGRGRRSINLDFASSGRNLLCLRLQRRSFSLATFNLRGETNDLQEYNIPSGQSASETFTEIARAMEIRINRSKKIDGIGLAVPGPFLERDERVILITESLEWQGFDLILELRSRFVGIPFYSTHDAKAAALAEWRETARIKGSSVMLYVSAGQGIGSALVVNGDVFRGAIGLAGELGHTSISFDGPICKCGNVGCLELFASRIALLRAIRATKAKSIGEDFNFDDIVNGYLNEDPDLTQEVNKVAGYLAQGVVNSINVLNPDLIVIGDEYARLGEKFLAEIQAHLEVKTLPSVYGAVKIELSTLKEDTVLKGTFLDVFSRTYLEAKSLA